MANTQIYIGGNGKTTLATAGKFCDRNIDVNVAVPSSGITPTGTKSITTNGTHDVTTFATAQVNVPVPDGYIKPSGTKSITTNGTHDVTSFASALVNIQTGITPTGSVTITENGTYDVTDKASAVVSIPGVKARLYTVTLASDVTASSSTILAANDYLKGLRSNEKAFVIMRYTGAAASTAMVTFWYSGNIPIAYSGTTVHRAFVIRQSASSAMIKAAGNALTAENWNCLLNIDANGRLYVHADTSYPVRAGTYQIIAGTMETL